MPPKRDTPAMKQYDAFKERHPDCILLFRMGDFYEMFDDDAVVASKALGIALTERTKGIPMAGVPYHSYESYVRRLLEAGHRVARCDQIQDAREAKGVVERAVTQVYTPGTLIDEALLDEGTPCSVASVCFHDSGDDPDGRTSAGVVELSTGVFLVFDGPAREVSEELARLGARELLYAQPGEGGSMEPPPRVARVLEALGVAGTPRPSWHFRLGEALEALLEHYRVATLEGFGLRNDDLIVPASGAIVRYLRETQAIDDAHRPTSEGHSSGSASAMHVRDRSLAHLEPPKRLDLGEGLILDRSARRALEIERTLRGESAEGSLLGVFQGAQRGEVRGCRTPMGRRLLRDWLVRPLADREAIEARHDIVGALVSDRVMASALGETLGRIQDVVRIVARLGLGRASPRDLVALGRSIGAAQELWELINPAPSFRDHAQRLDATRTALAPLADEIARTCQSEAPAHLREGGLICDGVDAALDEARALQRESGEWLARYQKELIDEHDLPSLKVGYNKVFGYYIELPKAQARRAPEAFTRKQTLTNAERYITPELKSYEEKVTRASEQGVSREIELFSALCAKASAQAREASSFARVAGELDVLLAFASKAAHAGWTRPEMRDRPMLAIEQGRHPVLDDLLRNQFVPNDCILGIDAPAEDSSPTPNLALITGPNMAGKSTYIRQVALLVVLAQAGSFVPAQSAILGVCDRIFTRIGADDALHQGQSTFMVEMIETARLLHHASPHSLVILDEIGRGTSTLDGLALAWAIAERLATPKAEGESPPRSLFATHYHELTDLAEHLPGRVKNLHVAVREWGDEIIFVHRILEGRASQSYGIHVARLAGIPRDVVARASGLLDELRVTHGAASTTPRAVDESGTQLSLFTEYVEHPAMIELKQLDLEGLSPLDAFDALRALKAQLGVGADEGPESPSESH